LPGLSSRPERGRNAGHRPWHGDRQTLPRTARRPHRFREPRGRRHDLPRRAAPVRFSRKFQRRTNHSLSPRRRRRTQSPRHPMKTILVIEDQPIMRHKTVTILKMEGFEVLEAGNGAEGIRLAHDELPDLILCDIMMPDRDGYEVLQAVRTNRATAITPF